PIFRLNLVLTCLLATWTSPKEALFARDALQAAPVTSPTTSDQGEAATVRFLAVDHNGDSVTDLRADELSVSVNKQSRRIVSLSQAASEPITIGLFFDISGSRRSDELIPQEIQSASRFLHSIWRPDDIGFVIAFGEIPVTLAKPTNDLQPIESALQKIHGATYRGSTALYDALCSVRITGARAAHSEKLFLVVGDFEDNSSRVSEDKMIEMVRGEDIRIFPFLRFEEENDPRMIHERRIIKIAQRAARKTGGDVLNVWVEKDLDKVFLRLTSELRGAYLVTYQPPPPEGKAKQPQIQTSRPNVKLLFPHN
ncbi:MAG: hypothetical protein WAN62_08050, partial [Candidatus Acidiferrum sp.]